MPKPNLTSVQNASLTKSTSSISNTNNNNAGGYINKQRNAQSTAIPRITTTLNSNDKEVVSTTTSALSNSSELKSFRQSNNIANGSNSNTGSNHASKSLSYIPRTKLVNAVQKNSGPKLELPNVLSAAISLSSLTDENTASFTSASSSASSSSSTSLSSTSTSPLTSETPEYDRSYSPELPELDKSQSTSKANKNKLNTSKSNYQQLTNRTQAQEPKEPKENAGREKQVENPEDTLSDIEADESFIIETLINLSNSEMAIRKKSDQMSNQSTSTAQATVPSVQASQKLLPNLKSDSTATINAKTNTNGEKKHTSRRHNHFLDENDYDKIRQQLSGLNWHVQLKVQGLIPDDEAKNQVSPWIYTPSNRHQFLPNATSNQMKMAKQNTTLGHGGNQTTSTLNLYRNFSDWRSHLIYYKQMKGYAHKILPEYYKIKPNQVQTIAPPKVMQAKSYADSIMPISSYLLVAAAEAATTTGSASSTYKTGTGFINLERSLQSFISSTRGNLEENDANPKTSATPPLPSPTKESVSETTTVLSSNALRPTNPSISHNVLEKINKIISSNSITTSSKQPLPAMNQMPQRTITNIDFKMDNVRKSSDLNQFSPNQKHIPYTRGNRTGGSMIRLAPKLERQYSQNQLNSLLAPANTSLNNTANNNTSNSLLNSTLTPTMNPNVNAVMENLFNAANPTSQQDRVPSAKLVKSGNRSGKRIMALYHRINENDYNSSSKTSNNISSSSSSNLSQQQLEKPQLPRTQTQLPSELGSMSGGKAPKLNLSSASSNVNKTQTSRAQATANTGNSTVTTTQNQFGQPQWSTFLASTNLQPRSQLPFKKLPSAISSVNNNPNTSASTNGNGSMNNFNKLNSQHQQMIMQHVLPSSGSTNASSEPTTQSLQVPTTLTVVSSEQLDPPGTAKSDTDTKPVGKSSYPLNSVRSTTMSKSNSISNPTGINMIGKTHLASSLRRQDKTSERIFNLMHHRRLKYQIAQ